jgi:hypothetical protein
MLKSEECYNAYSREKHSRTIQKDHLNGGFIGKLTSFQDFPCAKRG